MISTNKKFNIIILGKTGSGKSSLCNALVGKSAFKEFSGMSSGTNKCQIEINYLFGDTKNEKVEVIDTPGFMDSSGSDFEVINEVYELISNYKNKGFHLGILAISAGEIRCEGGISQTLQIFKNLISNDFLKNVIIVITQMNKMNCLITNEIQYKIKKEVPTILKNNGYELNYNKILFYNYGKVPNGLEEITELLSPRNIFNPILNSDMAYVYNKFKNNSKLQNSFLAMVTSRSDDVTMLSKMVQEMKLIEEQKKQDEIEMQKKRNRIINQAEEARKQFEKKRKLELERKIGKLHYHNLQISSGAYFSFICDLCSIGGNGTRHHCSICKFDICFTCFKKVYHGVEKTRVHYHTLYVTTRYSNWVCDCCRRNYSKQLSSWYCSRFDFDACIKCYWI